MHRAPTLLVLVLLGALVAAVGTFLQAARLGLGPVDVPYGVVVSLALTAAVCLAGGLATGSRSGALAAAAGWLLVLVLSLAPGPGGDVVLPARPLSYVWLLGGVVLVGMTLAAPYERMARRRAEREAGPRTGTSPQRAGEEAPK